MEMSWLDKLWQAQAERAERKDPWQLRLERVRGKIGYDGMERTTTQSLFDILRFRSAAVALALAVVWQRDDRIRMDRRQSAWANARRL